MRSIIKNHLISILLVAVMPHCLNAEVAEAQIRSAAEAFMAQVQGNARPGTWEHATVQRIESVRAAEGKWHMCTLATAESPAGYVLMTESGERLQPVMYSGTSLPLSFIQHLAFPATADASGPGQDLQIVPDVVLVAPITPELKDQDLTTTRSMAACAAVLGFLKNVKGYPLFDRIVFWPDRMRRVPHPEIVRLDPNVPFDRDAYEEIVRRSGKQFAAFLGDKKKAQQEHDLLEFVQGETSRGPQAGYRLKRSRETFRIISELRRGYLRDADPDLRSRLIADEQGLAEIVLHSGISGGMIDTFVLEHGYQRESKTIEEALADFFLSRGFEIECSTPAVTALSWDHLPAVLHEPSGNAGVIIGLSRGTTPRWLFLGIPETVPIKRSTFADLLRRTREAAGNPPSSDLSPEARARAERELSEGTPAQREAIVISDATANLPAGLEEGVHVVVQDCLVRWKTCVLSRITVGDNWGSVPVAFTER